MTRDEWIQRAAETFRSEGGLSSEDASVAASAALGLAGGRLDADPVEAARMLIAEG